VQITEEVDEATATQKYQFNPTIIGLKIIF
jgi:hypothetical protein